MTLPLAMLAALALAQPKAAACPPGKEISVDTKGQCCWPNQVWSGTRQACVGIPTCPSGLTTQGEDCKLVCPAGMEVGADTAGNCCWPSQVWSGSRRACVGIPSCPGGMVAQGEQCVAQAAPVPAPAPAPPPAIAEPAPPPPSDAPTAVANAEAKLIDGLVVPPAHHIQKKARLGLLIPGVAVLGVGYLIALLGDIGAGIYVAFKPASDCLRWVSQTAWIPLVGPPIAAGGQSNPSFRSDGGRPCPAEEPVYSLGIGLAVVDTIMQWGGLAMMILGLTLRQSVVVPDDPNAALTADPPFELYVHLGTQGSPLGMTVGLKTW